MQKYKEKMVFERFFEKSCEKIWRVQKKSLPLHSLLRKQHLKRRNGGSVAQLNRASDYGSEGCGFESRRNHKREV